MIRMGGFTLGKEEERGGGEGDRKREREREGAAGWFDLIGLGGDFDSLLIAFILQR